MIKVVLKTYIGSFLNYINPNQVVKIINW